MPWQVLYSNDELERPDRQPLPVGPRPLEKQAVRYASALTGPVRLKPVSLTIQADGTLSRSTDDDDDLD
jgi:hypothetical protein